MEFYNLDSNRVIEKLKSNKEKGLSRLEVSLRLKKYGYNKIEEEKKISKLKIFFNQFKSPLVYILLVAALISGLIGRLIDALVILIIVILNSLLGYYQEYKSERALQLLKKISSQHATVIRDNEIKQISAEELVPGDIIILETGDKVPADSRIIESFSIRTNEAILTGESAPVGKVLKKLNGKKVIADQDNMVFAGTVISYGHGKAIVTGTGKKTEFGKIAESLKEIEESETPLQKRISGFSHELGIIILILSAILVLIGVFIHKLPFVDSLILSIALAVGAIPEGLPAVVTISLALGVQKMAKNKALTRKLSSIETLGSVSVICSDKTGTLTKGEMTVKQIYSENKVIQVTGSGYETQGNFLLQGHKIDPKLIYKLLETSYLCNNAKLENNNPYGDPTEVALIAVAKKAGIESYYERIREIPFDSSKKYMATLDKSKEDQLIHMKGAPEVIIEMCTHYTEGNKILRINDKEKEKILAMNENFASKSLRVLAFAAGKSKEEMVFLGLMGMMDTPRENVAYSIKLCKKAGIRVLMITGDNALTAQTIGQKLGLRSSVMEGKDLDNISHEELLEKVKVIDIFARVNPEHKVKILKALQENGETVAMTGDGINDAPALKKADIGVAMGIKGSDVSKEASDMVLLDDSFVTIVKAIKQGRTIYDNIKKFVKYLLSANLAEVIIVAFALFLTIPLPFLPLQLLWINLITDSLPALALGVDNSEKNIMSRKPRPKKESILKGSFSFLILSGILGAAATLLMFILNLDSGEVYARTLALSTLILFELLLVFVARSNKETIFTKNPFENKWVPLAVLLSFAIHLVLVYTPLNSIFGIELMSFNDWLKVLLFAIVAIIPIEFSKLFKKN